MRNAPRIFSTRLPRGTQRVYRSVTLFYVALFFALLWPVYPRFAGIQPRVLGLPFSLAYVIAGVLLSFVVLWALFAWERRREVDPDLAGPAAHAEDARGGAPATRPGSNR